MGFADAERRATLACFQTSGLGVDVRYEPAAGAAVTTTAIFEDEPFVTGDAPAQASDTRTIARLLTAAVPAARRGDRLIVLPSGPTYRIEHDIRRNTLEATYVLARA